MLVGDDVAVLGEDKAGASAGRHGLLAKYIGGGLCGDAHDGVDRQGVDLGLGEALAGVIGGQLVGECVGNQLVVGAVLFGSIGGIAGSGLHSLLIITMNAVDGGGQCRAAHAAQQRHHQKHCYNFTCDLTLFLGLLGVSRRSALPVRRGIVAHGLTAEMHRIVFIHNGSLLASFDGHILLNNYDQCMTIEKTKFEFFRRAGLPGNGHLIQLSPLAPGLCATFQRQYVGSIIHHLQVNIFKNSYFDHSTI